MQHTGCKWNAFSLQLTKYRYATAISRNDKYLRFSPCRFQLQTAKVCIITALRHSIQCLDIIRRKDLFRCSVTLNLTAVHTDYLVGYLLCQIQFMQRHDHRHIPLSDHIFQNRQQFQLMSNIQERSRLIQNNNLRLLTDGSGQQNPLPLTVTDLREIAICQFFRMYQLHSFLHFLMILFA